MNIAVIGCGYVGLVSGTCLAALGHRLTGVDVDANRVAALQAGKVPIYEPGLSEMILQQTAARRLTFTTDLSAAVRESQVIFVAVGTPPSPQGGYDLSMLFGAVENIIAAAQEGKTIVIKSTVPPGTGEKVAQLAAKSAHRLEVVNNPEFLREGTAIHDFMNPDRIVFGAGTAEGLAVLREIYQPLIDKGFNILSMGRASAELTKFGANAMLAMRISFINELSRLASAVGADIESVRMGIGSDPRIGPAFLKAGIGYGGSCFPKDVAALVHQMESLNIKPHLLSGIEEANQQQRQHFVRRVLDAVSTVKSPVVALWGLAFKPDTDDIRESPAVDIARMLAAAGCAVRAFDPEAMDNTRRVLGDTITYATDITSATAGADAVVVATDWSVFITQNWHSIKQIMRGTHIFDGRNCLASGKVSSAGLHYHAVGRPPVKPGGGREGAVGVVVAG
jgi:UDPglucose 6-dehydrogenase